MLNDFQFTRSFELAGALRAKLTIGTSPLLPRDEETLREDIAAHASAAEARGRPEYIIAVKTFIGFDRVVEEKKRRKKKGRAVKEGGCGGKAGWRLPRATTI